MTTDAWIWWAHAPVAVLAFGVPAALLVRQDRRSTTGWLLATVAALFLVADGAAAWAWLDLVRRDGSLPGGEAALWLGSWVWLPAYFLLPTVLLLLAPEGVLPGPRWRPVLGGCVAVVGLATVVQATAPYSTSDLVVPDQPAVANPLESDAVQHWLGWTPALLVPAIVLALTALVLRRRRAVGRARRQLDLVVLGALGTVVLLGAGFVTPRPWFLLVVALALVPYPLALGVAAARHGNLDVAVRRSLVYGALSVAVVAAYVVSIVVLGGVLGRTTGAPLVATAIVAVGAAPFVARVQRAVDRRLFGDSADPAAAMRRVARRAGTLPDMARDVAASLRVPGARIVTATGQTGAWGTPREPETRVALRHGGAVVGELVASAREPGRSLTRRDEATLTELASYVAVVVHALQLSDDLQRSREQIVVAREEERRRLRRDLHDGLGPELAAIALELETVRDLADGPGTPAGAKAESLRTHVREVVSDVRRIVDDLRPPMLDDLGLAAAVEQQARRLSSPDLPVDVAVADLPPLSAAVELAVLRIAGEAMTNAVRHSGARHARVAVGWADGLVELVVADDGRGFDSPADGVGLGSMRERALELGGSCTVESAPGRGTTVRALLPAPGGCR